MTKKQRLTLLATIIGSGIVILDGSVVTLALPALSKEMGASFAHLQWIMDGYLLSLSALILLGGSLGDIYGRKRVYIIGLIGFCLSSMLCGIASTPDLLIFFRILQGVFGALLVPGALAIISSSFPTALRGKAIGQWAAWSGIGTVVGPFLGGILIDYFSWRAIFFINLPLALLCLWFIWHGASDQKVSRTRRLDWRGASLGVIALAGITYGLIEGPATHWHPSTFIALVVGVVASSLFLWSEKQNRDPMVPLSLFRSANFSAANLTTFAMYGALSGFFFAFTIFLQAEVGYSSLQAGLASLPVTFFLLFLSSKMGALASQFGPRIFMTVGPFLAAIAMLLLLAVPTQHTNYWLHILPGISLFGLGLAMLVSPLTATVMAAAPDHQSGIASGINNAISRVAGLLVIAALGLFGASQSYATTLWLCIGLALAAALVSALFIRQMPLVHKK